MLDDHRAHAPAVGEILAMPTLVALPENQSTNRWHHEREGSMVLAVLHGAECQPCLDYAGSLASQADRYRLWGGRPLIVLPSAGATARGFAERSPLQILADLSGSALARWHIGPREAAVLVADRWRQVYLAVNSGAGHELPDPETEITDVVMGIGIQCPECGVPDVPSTGL